MILKQSPKALNGKQKVLMYGLYGTKYSRMDQVEFVEDSL